VTVTAALVLLSITHSEDYEQLDLLGGLVKGAIVSPTYWSFRLGIKPEKVAAEHGAVGLPDLFDRHDDGIKQGETFPAGRVASARFACARGVWQRG